MPDRHEGLGAAFLHVLVPIGEQEASGMSEDKAM